jgi:glutamate--cysteine ligase
LPFARWIDEGHELGYPTTDDLAYHLTTLFPPIRPHGWLELRMLDMVPDPWWRVAVAVTTALLYDEDAAGRAEATVEAAEGLWLDAARSGLAHPKLQAAAMDIFDAAIEALDRIGCDPVTEAAVGDYADRYVGRGRSPADDTLDHLRTTTEAG